MAETTSQILKEFDTTQTIEHQQYKCNKCKDLGIMPITDLNVDSKILRDSEANYDNGSYLSINHHYVECDCQKSERYQARMRRSGLADIEKLKMDNYKVTYDWQKANRQKAIDFYKNPKQMFFMSGESGSGKTLLTSILANYFAFQGKEVLYQSWEKIVRKINNNYKSLSEKELKKLESVPVLLIDDWLKTVGNDVTKLSKHELQAARDIINSRYNNKRLITLISTELTDKQLNDIDASMFSRMYEMSTKKYMIVGNTSDGSRNMRYQLNE